MKPYIGVSGITSREEADACLAAFPPSTRLLMLGVLCSEKRLRRETPRLCARYPLIEDIAAIFPDDLRALNLLHYASDATPDRGTLHRLLRYGGTSCHGFQFNGAWPTVETLRWLRRRAPNDRVVLQVRTREYGSSAELLARLAPYSELCTDVLLDASCGEGKPLDVERAALTVVDLRCDGFHATHGIGVAGGLCAEAFDDPALRALSFFTNLDAEGKLRDTTPNGGRLSMPLVEAYLRAAVHATRGAL